MDDLKLPFVQTLGAVVLLALVYAVSGRLAMLLALPPGYASAFFPSAGIGIAAVVVGGARLLPGVFFGAFVLNVTLAFNQPTGLSSTVLIAASAIAVGSSLQCWLGSKLIKQLLRPELDSGRDVLLFPFLAALLCLVSPTISVSALFLLDIVPPGDFTGNWVTWWVGDTIGVLLAAPLTWIFIGKPRALWWSRRWLISLPLIVSSAVFITMYVKVSTLEHDQQMRNFNLKAQQVGDMLQYQFSEHERLVFTLASLLSEDRVVSQSQFKTVVRSYLDSSRELSAIGWAPKVTSSERVGFEKWAQDNLARSFVISQFNVNSTPTLAPMRPQYYPNTFLEPMTENNRALGLDLLSEPVRAAAVKRAVASGRPTASEPVMLIHKEGSKHGILLAQATRFRATEGNGPSEGMLLVAIQTERYLKHALERVNFADFGVRLEDTGATGALNVLTDSIRRPPREGDFIKTLDFGGRKYQFTLAPTDAYMAQQRGWQSWTALARGLVLTGLLGAFLLLLTGQRARIEAVVTDRTRKLREREARLNAILDNAADAILTIDRDGVVISVNGAAGTLFGYRDSVMCGLPLDTLIQIEEKGSAIALLETLSKKSQASKKAFGRHTDGRQFPVSIAVSLVEASDETFFVCILHDLTEQLWAQQQIYQLAHHDALTGLPNRFTLNLRLEQLLAMARRNQAAIALMYVNLDRFKKINDSQGQQVGDQLLMEAGKRLKQLLRDTDTVARLGGDEFVVILTNYAAVDDVMDIAQRIILAISEPYQLAEQNLHCGASVGISMFPDDGNNVDTLLRNADSAMQAAKSQGRGNYRFYSAELNAAANDRLLMENRIWLGLEREEFELYLQPQIHLASGRIVGAEALIRWHQPELGMVMPVRFIPIAEESDLIIPLGEWVLQRSMKILAGWQQGEFPGLRLAVNLSAKQCHSGNLLDTVDRLQQQSGALLSGLEMEITETAAMQDPEKTQELLRQLRTRGIMVAIDDFGTGYSSLNYLKLFAIDRIKIDRSFVKDIDTDQNDALIASATIALAHALGLQVIAEGVETESQRTFLDAQNCDEGQGYLFGRPMPLADFERLARGANSTEMLEETLARIPVTPPAV
ncbi:hypothetical protein BH11PSE11_BH11PSE11_09600 [soil metagenome]